MNLIKALEEAGLPTGVVNMVTGGGTAGRRAAHEPQGRAASCPSPAPPTSAARCPRPARPPFKHCHLEMGGKNIIMVMDDADLDLAVDGAVWGGFGTTGQRCTAASRVAVHKKVYKEFMERFVGARQGAARSATASSDDVQMGPCINESQRGDGREVREDRPRARAPSS